MAISKFRVVGKSPGLLTHNPAGMGADEGKPRKAGAAYDSPEVAAEKGCYRTEDGTCAIPGNAFRTAIVLASKKFKAKRGRGSLFGDLSHIMVVEDLVPLTTPNPGKPITTFDIDQRRVRVQRQGIIRARPLFRVWAAEFSVDYDDEIVEAEKIKVVLAEAGIKFGVGDYRPGCGGPFGRFDVID